MQYSENIIYKRLKSHEASLAVIGLGYVGLPVSLAFAEHFNVIGYDIDLHRIEELQKTYGADRKSITFTSSEKDLNKASFFIITIPTPIDSKKNPDLTLLFNATKTIAKYIKPGDYIVYESTVYPGCTENECVPILEKYSNLKLGKDFNVGYSPERINPNDSIHSFSNTTKIVAANNTIAQKNISMVYASAINSNIYEVSSIKVAESSKMLENAQRNVNIALMNEFSILFSHMKIDISEVIEAASTKWNFNQYRPGLVGGHCIPVDPYYMLSQATTLGIDMPVLQSSCFINDGMAEYIVQSLYNILSETDKKANNIRALLMGITYKENIDDIRNSMAVTIYELLKNKSINVDITDPYANPDKVFDMYGITLSKKPESLYNLIIVTTAHNAYTNLNENYFRSISDDNAVLADLRGLYKGKITSMKYWSL